MENLGLLTKKLLKHCILCFFGICFLWVSFVPSLYLVTLGEGIGEEWLVDLSPRMKGALLVVHFLILPVGLASGLRRAWLRFPSRCGVIAGGLMALWSSTTLLAVPALGVYPNLITVWFGVAISGGSNRGPSYFLPIIVANLLFWPVVVSGLFRRLRIKPG